MRTLASAALWALLVWTAASFVSLQVGVADVGMPLAAFVLVAFAIRHSTRRLAPSPQGANRGGFTVS